MFERLSARHPLKLCLLKEIRKGIKAKDTPWDAVQMGSVVCTVIAKLQPLF
ncbi:hypothetical protein [Gillisia sp. JM1]|uniref:hypothetical protein n=1 Tax=Gillisia sp. JM1 TaxID=1283286 RepID=UPI00040D6758|nr:hypothetical protein [Gillisia sp. JM1]